MFKTTLDRYPALEVHLLEHHPWDNPEIVAAPILAGSSACLSWPRQAIAPEESK
ncbi:divalent cation tolerance protein CutA [Kitasatospora sp. MAP12-44]|uniref:divalent cation tolerance protein CutA n=1 Tax=Kitasatospora sp. MAP12-44 TaxID=3035099 RepID=UPI0024738CBE|nr:divalent cation tolerance protein CutA [Kitasatospora sp. MAP12-44]